MNLYETGVVHGRFQVLHRDHMKYIMAGRARCRRLVVGISSPDPVLSGREQAAPGRDSEESNPLTYYQRQELVRAALAGEGVPLSEFTVVPFPVNRPDLLRHYVPMDAVFFLTIYDDWGREKLRRFTELGLATEVLWDVTPEEKGISAGEVRRLIIEGAPWEHLVPAAVARLLKEWGIAHILRV